MRLDEGFENIDIQAQDLLVALFGSQICKAKPSLTRSPSSPSLLSELVELSEWLWRSSLQSWKRYPRYYLYKYIGYLGKVA